LSGMSTPAGGGATSIPATVHSHTLASQYGHDDLFDLNPRDKLSTANGTIFMGNRPLPPLPQKMTPSQAARLAELLDFLHRHLTAATENMRTDDNAVQITLSFGDWQRILALQMVLARYVRAVAEPESLGN